MHQALRISEILFNIFGHCSTPTTELAESNYNADLAALARTCQTFKEPALDVLWEELYDLSPLALCLPDAYRLAEPKEKQGRYFGWKSLPCYLFSRPLKEVEWNTLRGYTRRVRFIRDSTFTYLHEETIRVVFSLAPFTAPLFPRLRSLCWRETFAFAPLHVAVPSLTILYLDLPYAPCPVREFFDAFGDRCPHIERFGVDIQHGPVDSISSAISRQICHWPNLELVHGHDVALNAHAILHLSSITTLKWLECTLEDDSIPDISHLGSILVFPNMIYLYIVSRPLDIITSLLPHIRLPATKRLYVDTSGYTSRRAIRAYWTAVREACPSGVLACLQLYGSIKLLEADGPLNEEALPCLTLEDLHPCTAFAQLRELQVNFDCPVNLTDDDLLELVSPRMEHFIINCDRGWRINVDGGGITLSGLVQLLRHRPSLNTLCLGIDTRTFTEIPEGMDVSFPARRWPRISFVDSYILPEFVPGLVSVLAALGLDPSMLEMWEQPQWQLVGRPELEHLWKRVLDGLKDASREQSLSSII